ncbi:MAG: GH92 family glycosyl hydrolase, partial [Saprospiraceae bacterium]|nr:GH92 family glycosyl hydrolase [Saprospiraceae bacterium]
ARLSSKLAIIILMFCGCMAEENGEVPLGLAGLVDPFLGTGGNGHVYPGATVPFGAVQLSPDNGNQGWDWCSGYNYRDSMIVGFSHTHLSGTGIGDLCDLLMMPAIGEIDLSRSVPSIREEDFASTFNHQHESAHPGYYQVTLDNGIQVELSALERTGFHKYTYPNSSERQIILDLGYHINWDRPVETALHTLGPAKFWGKRRSTGWALDQIVFFTLEFSETPTAVQFYDSTSLHSDASSIQGQKIRALFKFGSSSSSLEVKLGISSASESGASLALDEISNYNFGAARSAALDQWNSVLSNLEANSFNDTIEQIFYTSLYRTHLAPVIFEDAEGKYKAPNGSIQDSDGYTRYDIFSLWDTFRALHPLFTIIQPDRVNDFVKSLLAHYRESGTLPVWSLLGNETNTMTGYHAIPVITDAYFKGFRNYDVESAFHAMTTSAMQDIRGSDLYRQYGYVPHDLNGQSVTKTLEYAYDDWCISRMAFVLGKIEESHRFIERSNFFENVFDPTTGFMRARNSDGKWKVPFDPLFSDHNFDVAEYTEGNAWQHSWFVPHDVRKLIELHGGKEAFVHRLDSLFSISEKVTGDNTSPDISGLIGRYAHGNEPSHHIAYLYNYAGAPWKTQERVRQIMETQYFLTPEGLSGNEDCGQMSAWYVFSALGFYPVNPAEGVYVIGTPMLTKSVLHLPDGRRFTIRARFLTKENKYIQTAMLNEQPLSRSYLRHFEIMDGGELVLEMGPQPNYLHWTDEDALPLSASDPESDDF